MTYRAIIIDDEKWVVRSLVSTIRDQQYFNIIGEAYDGISGMEMIEELKPELAFVDIRIPGMSGLDILNAANTKKLDTLFIVISGYAEFAYAQKAMYHNAIGYCLKPFSKSELMDVMKKAYNILQNRTIKEEPKDKTDEFPSPGIIKVNNKVVRIMLDYIKTHYCDDISIQNLAELCSINSNYASQLFHQEVGETFSSYITRLRIKQAIHLLRNTDMTISAIATSVGYRDYFYFAKVFKKVTGITPSEYRNTPEKYPELSE